MCKLKESTLAVKFDLPYSHALAPEGEYCKKIQGVRDVCTVEYGTVYLIE